MKSFHSYINFIENVDPDTLVSQIDTSELARVLDNWEWDVNSEMWSDELPEEVQDEDDEMLRQYAVEYGREDFEEMPRDQVLQHLSDSLKTQIDESRPISEYPVLLRGLEELES